MADLSKIKAGLQSSTLKHRRVRHSSLISPAYALRLLQQHSTPTCGY